MPYGAHVTPVSDWLVLEDLAQHVYGHMRSFNLGTQEQDKDGFLDQMVFPTWKEADEGTMQEFLQLVAFSHASTREWEASMRHLQAIIVNFGNGWAATGQYSLGKKTNPYLAPWSELPQAVIEWNYAKDRHYKMVFEAATGLKLRHPNHDDKWIQQEIKAGGE